MLRLKPYDVKCVICSITNLILSRISANTDKDSSLLIESTVKQTDHWSIMYGSEFSGLMFDARYLQQIPLYFMDFIHSFYSKSKNFQLQSSSSKRDTFLLIFAKVFFSGNNFYFFYFTYFGKSLSYWKKSVFTKKVF